MTILTVLAYAASFACVGAYFASSYLGRASIFDWANAVSWPFIALSGVLVGAWPQVLLTVTFGAVGTYSLLHDALYGRFTLWRIGRQWKRTYLAEQQGFSSRAG